MSTGLDVPDHRAAAPRLVVRQRLWTSRIQKTRVPVEATTVIVTAERGDKSSFANLLDAERTMNRLALWTRTHLGAVKERHVHAGAGADRIAVERVALPSRLAMSQTPQRQAVLQLRWSQLRLGEDMHVIRPPAAASKRTRQERLQ